MSALNNRIRNIIQEKNLSPSHFADEIGVQRSSISHILSGRNKPSLDIVQKIVRRFPDLTYEWLLEETPSLSLAKVDKGGMAPSSGGFTNKAIDPQQIEPALIINKKTAKLRKKDSVRALSLTQEGGGSGSNDEQKRTRVVKITLFYDDNTFEEFKPGN